MVWRCHDILCFLFYFLSRTNGKRTTRLKRLKSLFMHFFLKYHSETSWSSYVQSFFVTISRHFDKDIWNDTLQLKTLRTRITIWTNFFLDNISFKENWWRCLENYHLHNNPSLLFEEHCTKTFHLLLYACFSLK